ncbi:store-operated calcium entry regulator STIMATE [Ixodes scapularis]
MSAKTVVHPYAARSSQLTKWMAGKTVVDERVADGSSRSVNRSKAAPSSCRRLDGDARPDTDRSCGKTKNISHLIAAKLPCPLTRCSRGGPFVGASVDVAVDGIARARSSVILIPAGKTVVDERVADGSSWSVNRSKAAPSSCRRLDGDARADTDRSCGKTKNISHLIAAKLPCPLARCSRGGPFVGASVDVAVDGIARARSSVILIPAGKTVVDERVADGSSRSVNRSKAAPSSCRRLDGDARADTDRSCGKTKNISHLIAAKLPCPLARCSRGGPFVGASVDVAVDGIARARSSVILIPAGKTVVDERVADGSSRSVNRSKAAPSSCRRLDGDARADTDRSCGKTKNISHLIAAKLPCPLARCSRGGPFVGASVDVAVDGIARARSSVILIPAGKTVVDERVADGSSRSVNRSKAAPSSCRRLDGDARADTDRSCGKTKNISHLIAAKLPCPLARCSRGGPFVGASVDVAVDGIARARSSVILIPAGKTVVDERVADGSSWSVNRSKAAPSSCRRLDGDARADTDRSCGKTKNISHLIAAKLPCPLARCSRGGPFVGASVDVAVDGIARARSSVILIPAGKTVVDERVADGSSRSVNRSKAAPSSCRRLDGDARADTDRSCGKTKNISHLIAAKLPCPLARCSRGGPFVGASVDVAVDGIARARSSVILIPAGNTVVDERVADGSSRSVNRSKAAPSSCRRLDGDARADTDRSCGKTKNISHLIAAKLPCPLARCSRGGPFVGASVDVAVDGIARARSSVILIPAGKTVVDERVADGSSWSVNRSKAAPSSCRRLDGDARADTDRSCGKTKNISHLIAAKLPCPLARCSRGGPFVGASVDVAVDGIARARSSVILIPAGKTVVDERVADGSSRSVNRSKAAPSSCRRLDGDARADTDRSCGKTKNISHLIAAKLPCPLARCSRGGPFVGASVDVAVDGIARARSSVILIPAGNTVVDERVADGSSRSVNRSKAAPSSCRRLDGDARADTDRSCGKTKNISHLIAAKLPCPLARCSRGGPFVGASVDVAVDGIARARSSVILIPAGKTVVDERVADGSSRSVNRSKAAPSSCRRLDGDARADTDRSCGKTKNISHLIAAKLPCPLARCSRGGPFVGASVDVAVDGIARARSSVILIPAGNTVVDERVADGSSRSVNRSKAAPSSCRRLDGDARADTDRSCGKTKNISHLIAAKLPCVIGFGSDTESAKNQTPPKARSSSKARRHSEIKRPLAASAFLLRVIDRPRYIVSFLLDSSVGLAFIFAGIRLTQHVSRRRGWNLLVFGEYGKPPDKRAWLAQGALYVLLMLCEKALSTLVVQLPFWDQVRLFIMSPIHNPKVEVALVVLVIPFFVNVLIFWVTDNFLMQHHPRLNGRNGSVNKKNPPKSSALRRSWVHPADEEPASWPECEGLLSGEERPGALS